MIGDRILQFEDLQEMCRPGKKPRLATVARWADDNGIRYKYDGEGGIWTTLDAVERAVRGGNPAGNDSAPPPVSELI
ncbi:MAG: hypothetical protein J0L59_01345 [Xanthomonadales bacterium]|nr:hypothetical protein [Xanthomonadales bacterium]